jgi:hypothetical protein
MENGRHECSSQSRTTVADFQVCSHEGLVTALNIDAGLDITEFPFQVAIDETVNVTTTGAGEVTILFATLPKEGYPTFTG